MFSRHKIIIEQTTSEVLEYFRIDVRDGKRDLFAIRQPQCKFDRDGNSTELNDEQRLEADRRQKKRMKY